MIYISFKVSIFSILLLQVPRESDCHCCCDSRSERKSCGEGGVLDRICDTPPGGSSSSVSRIGSLLDPVAALGYPLPDACVALRSVQSLQENFKVNY